MIYNIIEVANTHNGSVDYMESLIEQFASYGTGFGIKFQPYSADTIATKNYEWYQDYVISFFPPATWANFIHMAASSKDVWLDIFDTYGVQILSENIGRVKGIKLQVSVIFNFEVLNALSKLNIDNKSVIINVAGLDLPSIKERLAYIEKLLRPKEIHLEIGFQNYPTQLQDSGLSKIALLRSNFANQIVIADHLAGDSQDAIFFPIFAVAHGATIIEKHVMLEDRPTLQDTEASLTPSAYAVYVEKLNNYQSLLGADFINQREKNYFNKTMMIPLLNSDKKAGSLLSLERDFIFRRSGLRGLNVPQFEALQKAFYILSEDKNKGESIEPINFKKAVIGALVACRLKSSRLPKKALLKIGELSSVAFCIKNTLRLENINHTILATSTVEEDAILSEHTFSSQVGFYRGEPDDVISRYLAITRELKIDVVIRVTADLPFVDNEICQILLRSHFEKGADYTTAKLAADGTNLEIMNVAALERIKAYFQDAAHSEYMTWYFQNNPEHFHLNFVELPAELVRDYRLSLDYAEDLELFRLIHEHFTAKGIEEYSIRDIFAFLDNNPQAVAINSHKTLIYETDQELIATLNRVSKMH